jgi:hypothetical protein
VRGTARAARGTRVRRRQLRSFPSHHYLAMSYDNSYPAGRARSPYYRASSEITVIFSGVVRACIVDYVGSVDIITQLPKPTTAADRRSVRAAYQTCFTWMTRPRDSQELLALSQAQCKCGPRGSIVSSHRAGLKFIKQSSHKPFFILAGLILRLSFAGLAANPQGAVLQETQQRVHRLRYRQTWPRTWQDMLPHGPQDTVCMLIKLFDLEPPLVLCSTIMQTIEVIARSCHPLVLPGIIASPTSLIAGVVASIDECQRILEQQNAAESPNPHRIFDIQVCLDRVPNLLLGLFKFCHWAQRRAFHRGGASDLIMAYNRAESISHALVARHSHVSPDVASNVHSTLSQFGALDACVYDDCPDTWNDINQNARKRHNEAIIKPPSPEWNCWLQLRLLFHYFEVWQQCAAPGCFATVVDGPLWRCAGCLRVTYCSRGCQRRAWGNNIPHRLACNVLVKLQEGLDIPHRRVMISNSDRMLPPDWTVWHPLALTALNHFTELMEYNMQAFGEFAAARDHLSVD